MMFLALRKLGNICCGHKMFLNKIRNIFCVPDTKFVSATNVARAGKRGSICVGNNVSSFARGFKLIFCFSPYVRQDCPPPPDPKCVIRVTALELQTGEDLTR